MILRSFIELTLSFAGGSVKCNIQIVLDFLSGSVNMATDETAIGPYTRSSVLLVPEPHLCACACTGGEWRGRDKSG